MKRDWPTGPAGTALAAARKAAGFSQTALGEKAGMGRHAVSYWERKPHIDRRAWAVRRMAEAEPMIQELLEDCETTTRARMMGLSLPDNLTSNARARDRCYPLTGHDADFESAIAKELSRMQERIALRLARLRVVCGAKKTRKGTPCRNMSEPGKRRCKFHGGKSTGPRTVDGKSRIAAAQRKRWATAQSKPSP